jgi:hypothetical protein
MVTGRQAGQERPEKSWSSLPGEPRPWTIVPPGQPGPGTARTIGRPT